MTAVQDRDTFVNVVVNGNGSSMNDLSLLLKSIEIFSPLEDTQRKQLAKCLTEHVFEDRDIIAKMGQIADSMYIVKEGKV